MEKISLVFMYFGTKIILQIIFISVMCYNEIRLLGLVHLLWLSWAKLNLGLSYLKNNIFPSHLFKDPVLKLSSVKICIGRR